MYFLSDVPSNTSRVLTWDEGDLVTNCIPGLGLQLLHTNSSTVPEDHLVYHCGGRSSERFGDLFEGTHPGRHKQIPGMGRDRSSKLMRDRVSRGSQSPIPTPDHGYNAGRGVLLTCSPALLYHSQDYNFMSLASLLLVRGSCGIPVYGPSCVLNSSGCYTTILQQETQRT